MAYTAVSNAEPALVGFALALSIAQTGLTSLLLGGGSISRLRNGFLCRRILCQRLGSTQVSFRQMIDAGPTNASRPTFGTCRSRASMSLTVAASILKGDGFCASKSTRTVQAIDALRLDSRLAGSCFGIENDCPRSRIGVMVNAPPPRCCVVSRLGAPFEATSVANAVGVLAPSSILASRANATRVAHQCC